MEAGASVEGRRRRVEEAPSTVVVDYTAAKPELPQRWNAASATPAGSGRMAHEVRRMTATPTIRARRRIHGRCASFVLRQGRMSPAQQRALDELLPRVRDCLRARRRSTSTAFSRGAHRRFSRSASAWAKPRPRSPRHARSDNFLGIEVHGPGVGGLLKRIDELGLANVRVIRHDAVEVIAAMIPRASLAGIHVFFPDPWPKKRHHKRRLLKSGFVHELALRLAAGGYLHAATDWKDYADEMLATLCCRAAAREHGRRIRAAPRATGRSTKFETRGLRLGHPVRDVIFRRRDER